jgi:hypothetical protein
LQHHLKPLFSNKLEKLGFFLLWKMVNRLQEHSVLAFYVSGIISNSQKAGISFALGSLFSPNG